VNAFHSYNGLKSKTGQNAQQAKRDIDFSVLVWKGSQEIVKWKTLSDRNGKSQERN
jgi:hypothetical protein